MTSILLLADDRAVAERLLGRDTGAATAAEANAEDEQFCCRTVCFSGMDASGHGESEGAAVTRLRALGWGPAARFEPLRCAMCCVYIYV